MELTVLIGMDLSDNVNWESGEIQIRQLFKSFSIQETEEQTPTHHLRGWYGVPVMLYFRVQKVIVYVLIRII